ncbi:MAG: hypothetical protein OXO52_09870 [Rhodospirillales bacterium]|nr:hypothetical protein [Rhodospirillales bacterium]MDE0378866.1 hypothetical protein [Rhodospirillales bacterium]
MSSETKKGNKREPAKMPQGGPPTTSDEPESARQKTLAEEIMRDDSEVLRKLGG